MADLEPRLVLVRHSLPEFLMGIPASRWHLSAEGRHRCEKLARMLVPYDLSAVVASEEPKAVETGQIVAHRLRLPFGTAPGLHEHERGVVRDIRHREDFQAQVAAFFAVPDRLVFGYETAGEAHARFAAAAAAVLEKYAGGSLALVTHGTVMTLFISHANNVAPFPLWRSLGLPAYAVLSLPDLTLLDLVQEI